MPIDGPVHWHEGLFLQPHHLQMMQRHLLQRASAVRRLAFPFAYGLVEAQLSLDALANKQVHFDRLRVVMPSGLEIDCPTTGMLSPLSIKDRFDQDDKPFVVCVGVPLWQETRANTTENQESPQNLGRPIYSVATATRPDENTGENPQPIPVRRFNVRLLLDDQDKTDLEVLPVLKVVHSPEKEQDLPSEDRNFIPPCLVIGGSRNLRGRLIALANQVSSHRSELIRHLQGAGFSPKSVREDQVEKILRLRTLNRFASTFGHLFESPWTTPSQAYVQLRELLGELAALTPPSQDPFEVAEYDHDHLQFAFGKLLQIIPELLPGEKETGWSSREFKKQQHLWVVELNDDEVNKPIEYLLAVKSMEDPGQLMRVIPDGMNFRLDSQKHLLTPVNVRGIKLREERAPLGLPATSNTHYFRLQRTESPASVMAWERIKKDHTVALRWEILPATVFEEIKLHWRMAEGTNRS